MKSDVLKGKTIVVTRTIAGNKAWTAYFKERGAIVYPFPTIAILPQTSSPNVTTAIAHIANFDWIVFTSAAGISAMRTIAKKIGADISPAAMPQIAAIGIMTARTAEKMGYKTAFQPSEPTDSALARELGPVNGKKILLLRSRIASPEVVKILEARGADVADIPIYQTVTLSDPDPKFVEMLRKKKVDILTFASASAVLGFMKRAQAIPREYFVDLPAIALGSRTAWMLRQSGFKNISLAAEPSAEGVKNMILPLIS